MSKSATRNIRKSRAVKINEGAVPAHKPKFEIAEEVQSATPRMEAANQNQRQLISYLREGRAVTIAQGSAGTGKSFVAAWHAADLLKKKKIDKIVLVRANVSTGKSLGMLPGTLREKLEPFFAQTIAHLATFMGHGFTKYSLDKETISMQSIEHMRGMSISNAVVIVEESQNLTAEELEMILSRIGEGCQVVLTGDQKQTDLKGVSGLGSTIAMINKAVKDQPDYLDDDDLNELEDNIGIVTFTPDDVVRSGLCKAFVKLYYNQ